MKKTAFAFLAVISTATAEPVKDQDKLTTKTVGMGSVRVVEITGKADSEPLLVVWGAGQNDNMTVNPRQTITRKVSLRASYKITASEGGTIVDTESNTRKTGIVQQRKLR